MQTTIDKFGRIVIPKKVRRRTGLEPGTLVEVSEDWQSIIISPVEEHGSLIVCDDVLVYGALADGDIEHAIEQQRRQRLNDLDAMKRPDH